MPPAPKTKKKRAKGKRTKAKRTKKKQVKKRPAKARRRSAPKLDPKAVGLAVAEALRPALEKLGPRDDKGIVEALAPVLEKLGPLDEKVLARALSEAIPSSKGSDNSSLAFVSSEQRHTKPLQPYESYVYGFGLTIPVKLEDGDDVEQDATREKLRPKYQTIVKFLVGMMRDVEAEIDANRGVVS